MKALKITAHLEKGFSASDAWSPSLDSILAYFSLKNKLGSRQFNLDTAMGVQTTVDDLPLERICFDEKWWWACSTPEFDKQQEINRAFYKKFNIDTALMIERKVRNIELTKNQFKNYALIFKEIITDSVSWHVIGDEAKIMALLADCQQIGAKRGKGMGLVTKWSVSAGDMQKALYKRALPIEYAELKKIQGVKLWRGFCPSYRLTENQGLCVIN